MHIKNIIFDLDGTLIDSARLTGAIIDQMLAARGVKTHADRDLIRRMDAVGGEAMIAAVLGPHSVNPVAEITEFRVLHRKTVVPQDLPFPGVAATLAQLAAQGIGLAICSNKPQDLCEKILGEIGLAHYFAAIVGSTPSRPRKPSPDAALLALEGMGGLPENTLYCGDSAIDVATARAAGLAVTLVTWGYGTAEALLLEPDLSVLRTMSALTGGLNGHGQLRFPRGRNAG